MGKCVEQESVSSRSNHTDVDICPLDDIFSNDPTLVFLGPSIVLVLILKVEGGPLSGEPT